MFVVVMMFVGCNVSNVNSLKCVSMNKQECRLRQNIVDINNNEHYFILAVLM